MNKKVLVTLVLALSLSAATACSKKAEETTPAVAEVTTEATAEETTEEETELEETSMTGVIVSFTDTVLTVKDDSDDTEKEFDYSQAEVTREFPFSEGDEIEIIYLEGTAETPVPAISVEVYSSVIGENTDPYVEGTVKETAKNTVTLELEDGESYTFSTANAYIVAKDGIVADKKAKVTYIGDIDDTDPVPLAVKVVMEDSYNSADADKFAFIGKVASIEDESIVLQADDGDFYTFVSDEHDFSGYSIGDTLQITYTGTVTAKEIPAVKVVKK